MDQENKLYNLFEKFPGFEDISRELFNSIKNGITLDSCEAGDVLIDFGAPFGDVFFLLSGKLNEKYRTPKGKEVLITELIPLESFGVLPEHADIQSKVKISVEDPSEVIRINESEFRELLSAKPTLHNNFVKKSTDYLKKTELVYFIYELFEDLETDNLVGIDNDAQWVELKGGDVLFYEHDYSDCFYYLINGRLQAYKQDKLGESFILGDLFVGETVGEIGIFTDKNRTATVKALRDSLLLKINKTVFERLKKTAPHFPEKILQIILKRPDIKDKETYQRQAPKTISVVPVSDEISCDDFVLELVNSLRSSYSVILIDQKTVRKHMKSEGQDHLPMSHLNEMKFSKWLNQLEKDFNFIIFRADSKLDSWSSFCIDNSDEVLLIADTKNTPQKTITLPHKRHFRCHHRLVLIQDSNVDPTSKIHDWLAKYPSLDLHHHVRLSNHREDVHRVARFVSNRAVGLAFGGGGVRCVAHIGLIKALEEFGICIDYVAGTSGGALIGYMLAAGLTYEELYQTVIEMVKEARIDFTLPLFSFASGKRHKKVLEKILQNKQIEETVIPYFALSSNLSKAEPYIHKRGPILEAILASSSIPGIFPPIIKDGDILVDGGVLSILPVEALRKELNGGSIIASDVTCNNEYNNNTFDGYGSSGWKLFLQKIFMPKRVKLPNIMKFLIRSGELASIYHQREKRYENKADLYFRPPIDDFDTFDFNRYEEIIKIGYRYSKNLLDSTEIGHFLPIRQYYD